MTKPAAVLGVYTDFQFKKGLEVARITVEIPMKDAADFIEKFGAPIATLPVPVLLAKHDPTVTPVIDAEPEPTQPEPSAAAPTDLPVKTARSFKSLPRSAQVAIRCQDEAFQEWVLLPLLDVSKSTPYPFETGANDEENADRAVKHILKIASKKELDTDPKKAAEWDALETDWTLRGYAR